MIEERDERLFYHAAESLRAPGARDHQAIAEVLTALHHEVAEHQSVGASEALDRGKLRRRRSRGTARFFAGLAAGVAFAGGLGLGIWAGWRMRGESYRLAAEDMRARAPLAGVSPVAAPVTALESVQFMLVAPSASRVALVGEFNGWDPAATPMSRAGGGAWHVALPLTRGRHVYAFVVDGNSWVADPQAPLAPERWFGASNSVLLVNGERRQ